MGEWQPIETAPKDGTKILVYTCHGHVEVGEWYELTSPKYTPVEGGLFSMEQETYATGWNASGMPTHWMPLPAPPKE